MKTEIISNPSPEPDAQVDPVASLFSEMVEPPTTMAEADVSREKVAPENVIAEPGERVWPPTTVAAADAAREKVVPEIVMVEPGERVWPPMTMPLWRMEDSADDRCNAGMGALATLVIEGVVVGCWIISSTEVVAEGIVDLGCVFSVGLGAMTTLKLGGRLEVVRDD